MSTEPGTIHMVPTEELRPVLEAVLASHFGMPRRIDSLERATGKFQTSFTLEELVTVLEDGTRLELMFKNVGVEGLSERARAAKPMFVHDPQREIEAYALLSSAPPLGTAACYGSVVDPEAGRHWLFIEKVAGVALWQVGELETWRAVARWLASLHHAFAADPGLHERNERRRHLLRYESGLYRAWPERALSFTRAGDGDRRRLLERLTDRYDEVVARLEQLPVTFVHGEFYASNVIVDERSEEPRICPIDWENSGVGPGLLDLAALTTGNWSEAERTSLALAYREALDRLSGDAPPEAELLAALDWCHLHLAVQWLGWAPDWRAPRAHRYDWLGEATRMADKCGL